jgi:putative transposase
MKKRFSDEQIVAILREGQTGQKSVGVLCREHGIAVPTYYGWRRRFAAMDTPDVRCLRELEKDNARLTRLLAERDVEIDVMKEIIERKLPA